MGFLDKAMKAAVTAKDQVDHLREQREAASVTAVDGGPLDDHERQVLERAQAAGAPNPFALLTRAEAQSAIGAPVGDPSLSYSDDAVGARFQANSRGGRHWEVAVMVAHSVEDQPLDAHEYYGWIAGTQEGTAVAGVGESAVYAASNLFVLAPPHVFYIEARAPDGDVGVDVLTGLARLVLPRLVEQP
jgi:hypothetical protein